MPNAHHAKLALELKSLAKQWKQCQFGGKHHTKPVKLSAFTDAIEKAFDSLAAAKICALGTLAGHTGATKDYVIFQDAAGKESRPFRKDFLYATKAKLLAAWALLDTSANGSGTVAGLTANALDQLLYAATHYVACSFDVNSKNRTSAGKFFEMVVGTLFVQGLGAKLGCRPKLVAPTTYDLPVDVSINAGWAYNLVLATKLTSRERIVQPFVHHYIGQRALPGKFKTVIVCGSETNRIKKSPWLQETCVPGTIEVYRHYLGDVDGLIYLDIPKAYAVAGFAAPLKLRSLGTLATTSFAI